MKSRIYIFFIFIAFALIFTSAVLAATPSIKYLNRWPEVSPNTITKAGDYIYHGDGEVISVYHADDLDLRVRFAIPLSGDSTGTVDLEAGGVSGTEGIAGVFVRGGHLYVACGSEGLRIYEIPAAPEDMGPGNFKSAYPLIKEGKRVFVKDVYVADDNNTAYLAYYWFGGAGYDSGMQVLDVSDKTAPELLGDAQLTTLFPIELKKAQRVLVSGSYAYVADLYNGLVVFDVSDPADPQIAGVFHMGGVFDVAVSGDYAYLAGAGNGLILVDVKESDFKKGEVRYLKKASGSVYAESITMAAAVRVNNGYAYIGDGGMGLVIIDVSSPEIVSNTSVVGWYPYYLEEGEAETDMAGVFRLYVDEVDDEVMVYAGDSIIGLQKIGASNVNLIDDDPVLPSFVAQAKTPADAAALFIDVDTSYVYVVDDNPEINGFKEGLRILFAVESENMITFLLKGMLPTDGEARDVYVDDGYVYVADGGDGLKIIDPGLPAETAQPASPTLLGSLSMPGDDAIGVFVKDGYAYVTAQTGGLKIIDVSTPSAPSLVGEIAAPYVTDARSVEVSGDIAYVADGGEGLPGSDPGYIRLVDVSDKENPVLMGEFAIYDTDDKDDVPGVARDLALVHDLLYVAAGNEGIQVVDVSDPYNPEWYDQYNAAPYKDDNTAIFAVRPNANEDLDLIWVANGPSSISMGFLSHPKTVPLQRIMEYESSGNTKDVMAVGDYAYIADSAGGLHALGVDKGEAESGSWLDFVKSPNLHWKQFADGNSCFIGSAVGDPIPR